MNEIRIYVDYGDDVQEGVLAGDVITFENGATMTIKPHQELVLFVDPVYGEMLAGVDRASQD